MGEGKPLERKLTREKSLLFWGPGLTPPVQTGRTGPGVINRVAAFNRWGKGSANQLAQNFRLAPGPPPNCRGQPLGRPFGRNPGKKEFGAPVPANPFRKILESPPPKPPGFGF